MHSVIAPVSTKAYTSTGCISAFRGFESLTFTCTMPIMRHLHLKSTISAGIWQSWPYYRTLIGKPRSRVENRGIIQGTAAAPKLPAVYFATVRDLDNQNEKYLITDFIDDAILADPDASCVLFPGQLHHASRSGIIRQRQDSGFQTGGKIQG